MRYPPFLGLRLSCQRVEKVLKEVVTVIVVSGKSDGCLLYVGHLHPTYFDREPLLRQLQTAIFALQSIVFILERDKVLPS